MVLQVFDFIMDSLEKYRDLYQRMMQLMREGGPPSRTGRLDMDNGLRSSRQVSHLNRKNFWEH